MVEKSTPSINRIFYYYKKWCCGRTASQNQWEGPPSAAQPPDAVIFMFTYPDMQNR